MFAHVGELWPLKLQRSILFDVNETATCLSDVMWPYVYLNEGVYKFPFQRIPGRNFQRNLTNFLFTWLLCSSLAQSPVRLADRGAWKLWHISKNGKITSVLTENCDWKLWLKIVACFQKWEDYLSADCQLEELWWIVEDREGENWENVHPCRPQVRHLDEIVHSIVDCK